MGECSSSSFLGTAGGGDPTLNRDVSLDFNQRVLYRDTNLFIAFPRETQGSVRATCKPGRMARPHSWELAPSIMVMFASWTRKDHTLILTIE
jgi:hypothetical protein